MIALAGAVQKHDPPGVAVGAQFGDASDRGQRLIVGQMAGVREVAAIYERGSAAEFGHPLVVVAFDAQHIDARQVPTKRFRGVAQIGRQSDRSQGGVEAIADRALPIVLQTNRGDAESGPQVESIVIERPNQVRVE